MSKDRERATVPRKVITILGKVSKKKSGNFPLGRGGGGGAQKFQKPFTIFMFKKVYFFVMEVKV